MRIVMVTWEYPPLVVGGLAASVDGLARALTRSGHEVVVFTLHHPDVPDDYVDDGVRVLRARAELPWLPPDNFIAQMASANHMLVQLMERLDEWKPDLVHAHDWLAAWAGDTLRTLWDVPFVATIHATEKGRHGGATLPPGQPQGVNAVEWWLTFLARRVIVCTRFMVDEVSQGFDLPADKVDMIPNGVDPDRFAPPPDAPPREGADGPLIVSWGRLQYEKGFHTLVEAMATIRKAVPNARCVIAGKGGYADELKGLAHRLGVSDVVEFAGFVPDDDLKALLHRTSCVVIPSLYEPFGIVALEALAAGAPLVAAASGGLAEILGGTEAALLFEPGWADACADAVLRMLTEPGLAERCQRAGHALVAEGYTWDLVAAETLKTYERVLSADT